MHACVHTWDMDNVRGAQADPNREHPSPVEARHDQSVEKSDCHPCHKGHPAGQLESHADPERGQLCATDNADNGGGGGARYVTDNKGAGEGKYGQEGYFVFKCFVLTSMYITGTLFSSKQACVYVCVFLFNMRPYIFRQKQKMLRVYEYVHTWYVFQFKSSMCVFFSNTICVHTCFVKTHFFLFKNRQIFFHNKTYESVNMRISFVVKSMFFVVFTSCI